MDHFVKIDRLPDGFEFPVDLKDRFHFDPQSHKLIFRGYMSKGDFDRVSQLTRDWKFRRSLEELFCQCVPEQEARSGVTHRLAAVFARLFSRG